MEEEKTIEFKAYDKAQRKWVDPRWREVDSKNDKCPRDGSTMVVHSGKVLYAYCVKCSRYYIGE